MTDKIPSTENVVKRRSLELARSDVLRQLNAVRSEAHKEMLERALAALELELKDLPSKKG